MNFNLGFLTVLLIGIFSVGTNGREIVLDTNADVENWGNIVCHYADVTSDFRFWGCETPLDAIHQDNSKGYWTECERECYIEYNKMPSNLRNLKISSFVSGESQVIVEVVTPEVNHNLGQLSESSSTPIDIPQNDPAFDELVLTLWSRVGSNLIDKVILDFADGPSVTLDHISDIPEPVEGEIPLWETNCLHQEDHEDFKFWGCPVSTTSVFTTNGFWTNCQAACDIIYRGPRPTRVTVEGEFQGDGNVVVNGRVTSKIESPNAFKKISNTREWVDNQFDLTSYQDSTALRVRMTHKEGGFALIKQMVLDLDDDTTETPPPNPKIITLDTISDYSDTWQTDCKYGVDYDDYINNKQCQTSRNVQNVGAEGMWTPCSFKEATVCELIYYGGSRPKPNYITFRSLVESDNVRNASISVSYKRSLNVPDTNYQEVYRLTSTNFAWADSLIDLSTDTHSYVLRFLISSSGQGAAVLDKVVLTLGDGQAPSTTSTTTNPDQSTITQDPDYTGTTPTSDPDYTGTTPTSDPDYTGTTPTSDPNTTPNTCSKIIETRGLLLSLLIVSLFYIFS